MTRPRFRMPRLRRHVRPARGIAALAVLALAGAGLAGCASQAEASGTAPVTYMTWESNATNAAFDAAMTRFTASSGIAVQRDETPGADYAQKLGSLLLARRAPDFFWCTTAEAQNLAQEGLLYDWTNRLESGDGLDPSGFSPGALASWTTPKGRVAGIPTLANTYGFFYNADTFRAAGLAVPAPGWTWDDLFSDIAALKKKDPSVTPLATQWPVLESPQGISAYSVSYGGKPFLDDFTHASRVTADATFRKGAARMRAAIQASEMTDTDYDPTNAPAAFSAGKIPLMFAGQFVQQFIAPNKPTFDWGYAPWPAGPDGSVQPIETNGICSPSTLTDPDRTWKTISYLEGPGFDSAMKATPIAPIAYVPGTKGYYAGLTASGDAPSASIAATAKYELAAKRKFITQFLDTWATNAGSIVTTEWDPAISGHAPLPPGIESTVDGIRRLIGS